MHLLHYNVFVITKPVEKITREPFKRGKSMFCKECGTQLLDDAQFCPNCGEKVTNVISIEGAGTIKQVKDTIEIPEQSPIHIEKETVQNFENSKPQKSIFRYLIIVIAVLLIVVFIVVFRGKFANSQNDIENEPVMNDIEDESLSDDKIYDEVEQEENNSSVLDSDDESTEQQYEYSDEIINSETNTDLEYILPESDSRYLEIADLEGMTADECRIARNELFARHGRLFDDEELQAYFNSKSWYMGTIEPDDFSDDMFNEYEIANRELIIQYEKEQGYR